MGVPTPNPAHDIVTGLTIPRYYTIDDPVYADVDNRPVVDLAERDLDLLAMISGGSAYLDNIAGKVGESKTTPPVPGSIPAYSSHIYVANGDTHNVALAKLDLALSGIATTLGSHDHNSYHSGKQGGTTDEYYHVRQSVYEALIAYGGYTPSSTNPFVTKDYVGSVIPPTPIAYKVAYGWSSDAGADIDIYVDMTAGTICTGGYNVTPYGVYYGHTSFTAVYGWSLAIRKRDHTWEAGNSSVIHGIFDSVNQWHWQIFNTDGVTSGMFFIMGY